MKKLLYFLCFFALCACREIIEKDITNGVVTLVSPPNNYHSPSLYQTFYWSEMDGAGSYRLQIATPGFNPDSMLLVLDTVIRKTSFSKSLPYGKKFQWKVTAINNGYNSTSSETRTLYIDSSSVINFQEIEVAQKSDTLYSKSLSQTFRWTALPQATSYYFTVDSSGQPIIGPKKIIGTSVTQAFAHEGLYKWNVVGYDDVYYSKTTSKIISLDATAPSVQVTDKSTSNPADSVMQLSWSASDQPAFGRIALYRLYVYSDSLRQKVYLGYNGKVLNAPTERLPLRGETNATARNQFLWYYVQAEDKAGNTTLSSRAKITFLK